MPNTATGIFAPRTKHGQSQQTLTYKKHGDFLQVKMLIQRFHTPNTQPNVGTD